MSSKPLTHSDRSLTIPARYDQLRRANAFVSELAAQVGFAGLQLNRIELAVDEACSNIIQHAYANRTDGRIYIRVQAFPGERIVITIIDTGDPFDPDAVPVHDPNADLDNLKVGGLGLFLIKRVMDEVKFEFNVRGDGGAQPERFNRLTMVKHL